VEHAHPHINGTKPDGSCCVLLTDLYRGIAVDPATADVWVGGLVRSTKFHYSALARLGFTNRYGRFVGAEQWTEDRGPVTPPACTEAPCYRDNRIDVWPDAVPEESFPTQAQRVDDAITGIAALPNGTAYFGSSYLGLRLLGSTGGLISDDSARLFSKDVGALAYDTKDGSVWVAHHFAGGVDRLATIAPATDQRYSLNVFGKLANMGIDDVQIMNFGPSRKVLFGFRQSSTTAGFIAVYSGD
jgi:hypothetical protein